MTASRNITIKHVPDGKAMTLDEWAAFVQDAMRAGATGSEIPKVRINFGGTVKSAETTITAEEPADASAEA